ncbi:hypothetical protein ASPWEDRAFT_167054 [Aspergillus wentii DTO 134E9]|uniref:FAD-binding PCMH-type domain-containing protein n=1 Tax=Aspergillus wentii DTO 134E9 TaxID=1073089 RepID=A0A1L9S1K4_ASPWE|nr:uncharacterized protein ASPWEDRAFT_167054 [Aspergillus wentii DTO 134E9]KAI9930994.1 hypothetical protein MW887_010649 [Aspergillus wentii]OJJ41013.1 hypothetical protein ASPWEDRAFT_167054 [Aspergillus wentii DTO 134E9]
MGITASSTGRDCLLSAVGGNPALVTFHGGLLQGGLLYQPLAVQPYNLNWPVTPIAVTFPKTSQQVAEIVKCAADNGYKVQPKSGGHSYGNYGLGGTDGAVVVDLKHFQQFSMDETTYHATIGAGTLLGDVTSRLYKAGGRAMAHGVCPHVGVGGHFTIGGLGPTSRQWGSALDHVEEVEVVLANSSIVRASNTENPDVFFAVKGAAASFGIVTEFKVRTEPAPSEAVQYSYTLNLGSAHERARLFKDWQAFISNPNLTRKFGTVLTILDHGILLSGTFYGSKDEYDALDLENRFPLTGPGEVIVLTDWLGMTGHAIEDLVVGIAGDVPCSFYAKSMSFTPDSLIPSSAIDDLFNYLDTVDKGTPTWFISFDLEGGATNDYAVNATAYSHRNALYWLQSYAISPLGPVSDTTIEFLNGINRLIAKSMPQADLSAYPGYVDPLMRNAQSAYWGPNLPRLQGIKASIDPKDVFHNPQSVNVAKD